ncbi:HNH endonuclease [Lysobacter sp. F6437]|uniref:HNH endonuclease n=1 Tax=Lysobacter sp. F6437 TaxID=3459296 RepID=UPI00403DC3D2
MAFPESVTKEVKRKAHFQCCLCKAIGVEIHHILPQAERGPDTAENAAPLCPSCHETYGANPTKRKFIREARDLWYEICEKRYAPDASILQEVRDAVSSTASKSDLSELRQEILASLKALTIPPGVLSVPVPRNQSKDQERNLTVSDFMVMIFGLSSERPEDQVELLCIRELWPIKDGFRATYNDFLKQFGTVSLRHLAARALDYIKAPPRGGLTEEEINSAISLMSVEAVCLSELSKGEFRAVLREDGEVIWFAGNTDAH